MEKEKPSSSGSITLPSKKRRKREREPEDDTGSGVRNGSNGERESSYDAVVSIVHGSGRNQTLEGVPSRDYHAYAGTVPEGEVKLIRALGEGQYGIVYQAQINSVMVAVKVIKEELLRIGEQERQQIQQLRQEIHIMSTHAHQNITRGMGSSILNQNRFAIILELCHGDLERLLIKAPPRVPLTLLERLRLARDAFAGLSWLHNYQPAVVHKDLKLANILYTKTGSTYCAKISDFGLSVIKPRPDVTLPRDPRGTPHTMAPEVMMHPTYTEKADIYSMGLILWQIVTCKPLFPTFKKSLFQKLGCTHTRPCACEFVYAICQGHLRPELNAVRSPELRILMQRCWAPQPNSRPDCNSVITELDIIILKHAIADQNGRQFWAQAFFHTEDKYSVPWKVFIECFYQFLNHPLPIDLGEKDPPDDVIQCRLLRALLVNEADERVTMDKFGQFLSWFGPLDCSNCEQVTSMGGSTFADEEEEEEELTLNQNKWRAGESDLIMPPLGPASENYTDVPNLRDDMLDFENQERLRRRMMMHHGGGGENEGDAFMETSSNPATPSNSFMNLSVPMLPSSPSTYNNSHQQQNNHHLHQLTRCHHNNITTTTNHNSDEEEDTEHNRQNARRDSYRCILRTLQAIVHNTWFYGFLDANGAAELLRHSLPGTYLLRFSSLPGCYALSRVKAAGQVLSVRIQRSPITRRWRAVSDNTPCGAAAAGENEGEGDGWYASLRELLMALRAPLRLQQCLPGSRFLVDTVPPPHEYQLNVGE